MTVHKATVNSIASNSFLYSLGGIYRNMTRVPSKIFPWPDVEGKQFYRLHDNITKEETSYKNNKKTQATLNLRVAKLKDTETNTEKIIRPFTDNAVLCK